MDESFDPAFLNLIVALRGTKKDVCALAANRLDAIRDTTSRFDLHLRQADLTEAGALSIAAALNGLSPNSGPFVRSFSISYNPNIQGRGAIALITALPQTITEIGMVGCNLGDASGQILQDWVPTAPALRMLCVEQNRFSTNMRRRIANIRKQRSGLTVVV